MNRSRLWTLALGALCLGLSAGPAAADPPPSKPAGEVLDAQALAARIDQYINARLGQSGVIPAPLADDAEFLRRVYLDLIGRIPRVAEARAFLDDPSPEKRRRLVERLLDSPQYVTHFGNTWTAVILPQNNNQFRQNLAGTFKPWIEKQIRENVPYDQMVRELLTLPQGGLGNPGVRVAQPGNVRPAVPTPVAFYQVNELKPENLAASTSRVFLGVRLECAQCHDHPFNEWKRQNFWELAAFFAGIRAPARVPPGRAPQAALNPNASSIKIPGTEKVVEARFLDGAAPKLEPQMNPRTALADWVTAENNPYFARTGANRVWGHFFGIGLIDPVDDEPTEDNPASHAELLADLTRQFVAHKYDVKYLIRAITASQAYQRTSAVTDRAQNEPRLFARMALRGLTPEQLFDSLAQATGYREPRLGGPVLGRPIDPRSPRTQFLVKFASQERKTETQTSILQALSLMNGKFIADATSLERSTTLAAVVDAPFLSTARRVETLYLAALTRRPRAEELARMVAYVEGGGPRGSQDAALADVFWVLLNSSEFILNH
jgi:hypothetical protein